MNINPNYILLNNGDKYQPFSFTKNSELKLSPEFKDLDIIDINFGSSKNINTFIDSNCHIYLKSREINNNKLLKFECPTQFSYAIPEDFNNKKLLLTMGMEKECICCIYAIDNNQDLWLSILDKYLNLRFNKIKLTVDVNGPIYTFGSNIFVSINGTHHLLDTEDDFKILNDINIINYKDAIIYQDTKKPFLDITGNFYIPEFLNNCSDNNNIFHNTAYITKNYADNDIEFLNCENSRIIDIPGENIVNVYFYPALRIAITEKNNVYISFFEKCCEHEDVKNDFSLLKYQDQPIFYPEQQIIISKVRSANIL